jgi:hypothetical protein
MLLLTYEDDGCRLSCGGLVGVLRRLGGYLSVMVDGMLRLPWTQDKKRAARKKQRQTSVYV